MKAMAGPQQPGFVEFVSFAQDCERCWVKLTGAYRISVEPGFADTVPLARALIAAVPERVIKRVRDQILVENPQRCFGF